MRGVITQEINVRQTPGMESEPLGFYKPGDIVEIVSSMEGEDYDGEDLWYRLNTGTFLWSGGVSVRWDATLLELEDRQQFFLSYRKNKRDDRTPDLDTREIPDGLHFSQVILPADSESLRVDHFSPADFARMVVDSVNGLNKKRKHVLVYIHGYQLFSSLKLDLLENFVMNYFTLDEKNQIAKVIFLSWPSQGSPDRKAVDDRSIRAGQQFTANNLFDYFVELSEQLKESGKSLNLLVHSFGHQLLNGMLNPKPEDMGKIPNHQIFRNIFLMAPDVTHLVFHKDGQLLRNYFKDSHGEDYMYNFEQLKKLAGNVHVFFDRHDYLLYISTTKFLGKDNLGDKSTTEKYRSLGNYGPSGISRPELQEGFTWWDVGELIKQFEPGDLLQYPFQSLKRSTIRGIDRVWSDADYDKIKGIKVLFNLKRFPNRHRYLFTCRQVVNKVTELLANS